MNTELEKIYDEFAETYRENRGLFDVTEVFESFYRRLHVRKGALLDLGCGAGEPFAAMFVDRGWTVTGVDFSARMLELAAEYVPQMKTIRADMRRVEFQPGAFDAITAVYSLFHVPSAEHPALFRRLHCWLRPHARLLFTYAVKEYTGSGEFDGCKEFMGKMLYYSHQTPVQLYAVLEKTGFEIEAADYRTIGGETFLWITAAKRPP